MMFLSSGNSHRFFSNLFLFLSLSIAYCAHAEVHEKLLTIENLQEVGVTELTANLNGKKQTLTISSREQSFELELEENSSLTEKFKTHGSSSQKLLKGKVKGNSASWVRLSAIDGVYSGTIYDGKELFIVDRTDSLHETMSESQRERFAIQPKDTQVIYKASDITNHGFCGLKNHNHASSAFNYHSFVEELNLSSDSLATREIEVAIVADTEFSDDFPGAAQQQMLSIMNDVDGIFSEQVNVHLSVVSSEVLTDNGPLTTNEPEPLIYDFRNYIFNGSGNPGLTHLFTGKNLQENVLGIAFVSELCSSYGVGLSQNIGNSTFFVVAHEFGHNFGAPHDNQSGSACSSTSNNFLMNPSINQQDQFSACSLAQITSHIDFVNSQTGGACVTNRVSLAPTISSEPNPNATVGFAYLYDEDNSLNVTGGDPFSYVLDSFPSGMSITQNGLINWIPTTQQVGDNPVQITVSNSQGSDTQNFNVRVWEPIAPDAGVLDFNTNPTSAYGETQDDPTSGIVTIEDSGATLVMTGNRWQKIDFPYTITEATVLEFDFKSTVEAEVQGIGLDDDLILSQEKTFNLYGIQDWGVQNYRYNGTGDYQRFSIPIGQYYTGEMSYMFFALDHDVETPNGNASFSNINVYETFASADLSFPNSLEGNVLPAGETFAIEAVTSADSSISLETVEFSLDQELWVSAINTDGTFRVDDFGPVEVGTGEIFLRLNGTTLQNVTYTAGLRPSAAEVGYYFINPNWVGNEINIYALADNTNITIGGTQQTLSKGQSISYSIATQGEYIFANKVFSVGTNKNGLDLPVPSSFKGTEFVVPHIRFSHVYHFLSPNQDTDVQISIGSTSSTIQLIAGEVFTFEAGDQNNIAGVVQSDVPILMTHISDKNSDTYPVPPLTTELWGVRSAKAFVAAFEDNTNVTVYSNTGATRNWLLNSGEVKIVDISSPGSEGAGSAIHVVSDKPVAAIQHADSDGSETSAFWSNEFFASEYILPVATQYIAIVCATDTSTVTLYNAADQEVSSIDCIAENDTPGKGYFGSTIDGANIEAGSRVESSSPVFIYYEESNFNNERNLLGTKGQTDILDLSYVGSGSSSEITVEDEFIAIATQLVNDNPPIQQLEFSIDQLNWFDADLVNANYSFNFGQLSAGQYSLFSRVNGSVVQSITFVVSNIAQVGDTGYYFVNPDWIGTAVNIFALSDNTNLSIGGQQQTLNEGDSIVHIITIQGEHLFADKAFSVGTDASGLDLPIPNNFMSTTFVNPHVRFSHTYHMLSPQQDTEVQISVGATSSTLQLIAGQVLSFDAGDQNDLAAVIRSDAPILATHSANQNANNYPLPPASNELWGVRSAKAYVAALEDSSEINIYSNTGAVRSVILNAGEVHFINFSSSASDGRGSAYYLNSNKPIAAIQTADSDGSESTGFWSSEYFSENYTLPVNTQYVAVVCSNVDTTITLYDETNSVTEVAQCTTSGTTPGKAYFGSPVDGANISKGSTIMATAPIYLIYEAAETDEERNLAGALN